MVESFLAAAARFAVTSERNATNKKCSKCGGAMDDYGIAVGHFRCAKCRDKLKDA